jgi:hypothetical protein
VHTARTSGVGESGRRAACMARPSRVISLAARRHLCDRQLTVARRRHDPHPSARPHRTAPARLAALQAHRLAGRGRRAPGRLDAGRADHYVYALTGLPGGRPHDRARAPVTSVVTAGDGPVTDRGRKGARVQEPSEPPGALSASGTRRRPPEGSRAPRRGGGRRVRAARTQRGRRRGSSRPVPARASGAAIVRPLGCGGPGPSARSAR